MFEIHIENQIKKLKEEQKVLFDALYNRRKKNMIITYLLLTFGLHYLYFSKWGYQVLFWCTFGGFGVWWIVDLIRMYSEVSKVNNDIAFQVLQEVKNLK